MEIFSELQALCAGSFRVFFVPLTLSQCALAGPVYTGMPLECHWLNQCTLGYHWATQWILAGYTGTPAEKRSWNSPRLECYWRNLVESTPHLDDTGETRTFAAYTGTPLGGGGGTPVCKWTGLCIISLYLEFTALQWMPVLLLTHVGTSTLLCACFWYEHHYSFLCIWGCKSNEIKQLSPYQLYT